MADFFQHENALVETNRIGKNTRVWAFAHVLPGAIIGEDCNICDHTFIENDVKIGDRVTIKSGVQLWDGITLEDDTFVGPNATFTNDPFPRSKQHPDQYIRITICKGASIGANATLLPGITVGQYAMVGAGAVVTRDVPPYAIVVGNPAQITGYVQDQINPIKTESLTEKSRSLDVRDVRLFELPLIVDLRGSLTFAEYGEILPFIPKRYFLVFDVPGKEIRGEHAHRKCHQFLTCIKGECSVIVDDGQKRAEILLNRSNQGLHIPPMIWALQYKYSQDAILLVLASRKYEAQDYIRDYAEFLREVTE